MSKKPINIIQISLNCLLTNPTVISDKITEIDINYTSKN